MRSPLQAMLWELWRTSCGELLVRLVATTGMILLLCSLPFAKALTQAENEVVCGVVVMILTAGSLTSSMWWMQFDRDHSGFSFRLGFVRPVTTIKLVVLPMVYTAAASVLSFALPAALFGRLHGVPMPSWSPTPVVACVVFCLMAVTWSPATIFARVVSASVLLIAMAATLLAYHRAYAGSDPILMAIGKPEFYEFSWYGDAGILFVSMLAVAITVVSVGRQRHGDHLRKRQIARTIPRNVTTIGVPQLPFKSRYAAQCWYEARQCGTKVVLFALVAPVVLFAFLLVGARTNPTSAAAPSIWLGAIALCPILYQIVGADGALGLSQRQGAVKLSTFAGTLPMTEGELIACKLLVIAACSFFGTLLMMAAAFVHALVRGDWHAWSSIGDVVSRVAGDITPFWWAAVVSSGLLLYLSTCSILLALGLWIPQHPRILLGLAAFFYLHFGIAVWDMRHNWRLQPMWSAYGYLLAAVIIAGCLVAIKRAVSARNVGKGLLLGALALWCVYAGSTIALYAKMSLPVQIPNAVLVLGVALLIVPLATTAFAPLAYASHRHR